VIKQLNGEIVSIDYSQQVALSISIAENADLSTLDLYRINLSDD
jgi:hypothetical protein